MPPKIGVTGKVEVETFDWVNELKWQHRLTRSFIICRAIEFAKANHVSFNKFLKSNIQ